MRHNLTLATTIAATAIATIAIFVLTPIAGFSAQRVGGGGGGGGGGHLVGGGGGGARFTAHVGGVARAHFARYASPRASGNFRAAHNVNTGRHPANVGAARNANQELNIKSAAVHNASNSRAVAGTLRNAGALHDPHARALIAANAATAGWRHGDNGWWRHRNGGFGWVGPLFWPFAYYDKLCALGLRL